MSGDRNNKRHRKATVFGGAFNNRDLRGLGSNGPLNRQRGFKGATTGPASEGRILTAEERAAIEAKMREQGKL